MKQLPSSTALLSTNEQAETPSAVGWVTRSFLEDHHDLEDGLQTLLKHEKEDGPWTFDHTSLDSDQFGKLVFQEFAEQTDDGNRCCF